LPYRRRSKVAANETVKYLRDSFNVSIKSGMDPARAFEVYSELGAKLRKEGILSDGQFFFFIGEIYAAASLGGLRMLG
jgi:hypothetical protein